MSTSCPNNVCVYVLVSLPFSGILFDWTAVAHHENVTQRKEGYENAFEKSFEISPHLTFTLT